MSSSGEQTAEKVQTQEPVNEIEVKNKLINETSEKLNKLLLINIAYYLIVFIVIGLPIWFLTTSTYRAPLPFDEIDEISSIQKLQYKTQIELIDLNEQTSEAKLSEIKRSLQNQLNSDLNQNEGFTFTFQVSTRKFTKQEQEIVAQSQTIAQLDEKLSNTEKSSLTSLRVFVLSESLVEKFAINLDSIFLNSLYVNPKLDTNQLSSRILNDYLHIQDMVIRYNKKLGVERKLPSKQELKVVKFDNEYEITFSLINEKPEVLDSDWNIEYCIEKYFRRIVDQISKYVSFSIKAQSLLYSDFNSFSFGQTKNGDTNEVLYYYIKPSDLSIMTNHIENRLGARISDSSALEFVLYEPSKQPLFIISDPKDTNSVKTRAFLVPKWGGIYIDNQMVKTNSSNKIEADEAMKTFLTQFIDLMGFELHKNQGQFSRSKIYSSEIYGYLLKKTLENQLNSINTLKSLSLLLTRISNMVIEDEIANQIKLSVNSVKRSIEMARSGDIERAFFESKTAFMASEKAFFDKSLLEKLYFPDDQRFAIYIPLFIPVGIPIVLSIKVLVKWFKTKQNKAKSE